MISSLELFRIELRWVLTWDVLAEVEVREAERLCALEDVLERVLGMRAELTAVRVVRVRHLCPLSSGDLEEELVVQLP